MVFLKGYCIFRIGAHKLFCIYFLFVGFGGFLEWKFDGERFESAHFAQLHIIERCWRVGKIDYPNSSVCRIRFSGRTIYDSRKTTNLMPSCKKFTRSAQGNLHIFDIICTDTKILYLRIGFSGCDEH